MARILGVNLPQQKKIAYALRSIYGIGIVRANDIIAQAKIDPDTRTKDLNDEEVNRIREIIERTGPYEGDLRRVVISNIKRHRDIRSYVGVRHEKKLPVHGQRTKTNTRTVRGNVRRTMGSGRKKSAEKT